MNSQLRHARPTAKLAVFILLLLLSACGASPQEAPVPVPQPLAGVAADVPAPRSPPAIEALGRGIAAVTPPGAALQDIFYPFDSTSLISEAEDILKRNAQWMKANPTARVEIEGHCDDIGSDEYNLALGAKRAQIAKDFLVSQGVAPERLVTISYGKEAPACFELTEACRVQNRRARFVIFTELPNS
jgi:peptidoglycan-associated lipoprotein